MELVPEHCTLAAHCSPRIGKMQRTSSLCSILFDFFFFFILLGPEQGTFKDPIVFQIILYY